MKVSVASLSYNQKEQLKKLYNSLVQNKDYLDVWSLWDDGSTDGSVEMIKQWEKDDQIPMRVNYHTGKSTTAERMNWSIQNTNDLFIQVFGDSYIESDGLKKISETYVDGSAGSGYRIDINQQGVVREEHRFENSEVDKNGVVCMMREDKPWQWMCGNGFICRREYMEKIGWYDSYSGYGFDDYDWFMRLMMNGYPLYAYNNIKVYHHDHPTAQYNPESKEKYENKLKGLGYGFDPKIVVLDIDDFSVEVNNLYYLDLMKKTYPKFKVSMFYIPFDYQNYDRLMDFQRQDVARMIRERLDWIELIPHGLTHTKQEMMEIKDDDYETIFKAIREGFDHYGFPMVKGFKAPQWLYKQNLVDYLDSKGWWMAVDRNVPTAPKTNKYYQYTHSIHEPFWLSAQDEVRLHGHISLPSANNFTGNLTNLMKIGPETEWKFISEVV